MDLLEYQAKELFRQIGIPVLPSQRIDHPSDLKDLKIPYPVVLKSQVPKGGRGRAGGVKFVENTIDAIAAAQTIFHLPIMGEYPQVLLAEARYNAKREFYLAVALDYTLRRPVLWGSPQGGIDSEAVKAQLQQVVVEREFSPFYARRLALKMGLQGKLILSVSAILEAMFKLFIEKDLDFVEINPLGISPSGEVMALDGKVIANDAALGRHPELAMLATRREKTNGRMRYETVSAFLPPSHPAIPLELQPVGSPTMPYWTGSQREGVCPKGDMTDLFDVLSHKHVPQLVEPQGNIAVVCNGTALAMTTLDLIYQTGGKPASYLDLGEETTDNATVSNLCDRLEKGLKLFAENSSIKVVLVNILSGATSWDDVASVIAKYIPPHTEPLPEVKPPSGRQRRTGSVTQQATTPVVVRSQTHYPHLVLRLVGSSLDLVKERLATLGISVVDKLDEAVSKAVSLAKSASKGS